MKIFVKEEIVSKLYRKVAIEESFSLIFQTVCTTYNYSQSKFSFYNLSEEFIKYFVKFTVVFYFFINDDLNDLRNNRSWLIMRRKDEMSVSTISKCNYNVTKKLDKYNIPCKSLEIAELVHRLLSPSRRYRSGPGIPLFNPSARRSRY